MLKNAYFVEIFDSHMRFVKIFRNVSSACDFGARYIFNRRDLLGGKNEDLSFLKKELYEEGSLTREYKDDIPYIFVTVTECEVV